METTSTEEVQPLVTSSAKDILLAKVRELEEEAQQYEFERCYKEAIPLYQRASEILHGILSNDPQANVEIALRMKEVLSSKERAQHLQDIENTQPASPSEPSTECRVILSIENISVHQIFGLQGMNNRRFLGTGVLRVLKCTATSDLFMMQLIPSNDETQFQFPLAKSIPCLCTAHGYYVFPMPGNIFYGIVFPKEIPDIYLNIFENVLEESCCFRKVPSMPPVEEESTTAIVTTTVTSTEIVVAQQPSAPMSVRALHAVNTGIAVGGEKLADGITVGSHYIAIGIEKGAGFIKERITPSEEPLKVSPKVSTSLYVAGKMAPVCVGISKALIASFVTLAEQLGSVIADSVSKTEFASKIAAKKDSPVGLAAKEVGKTSLKAFVNIWEAAEQAGRLLLSETRTATVDIIEKKYGQEAAAVAGDGLSITGNVIETAYNVNQLGIKRLAERTARHTSINTFNRLTGPEEKGSERLALTDK